MTDAPEKIYVMIEKIGDFHCANGKLCDLSIEGYTPYYSAAAIRAAREEGRKEGLREAAEWIDKKHRGDLPDHIVSEDGNAIRALIDGGRYD